MSAVLSIQGHINSPTRNTRYDMSATRTVLVFSTLSNFLHQQIPSQLASSQSDLAVKPACWCRIFI